MALIYNPNSEFLREPNLLMPGKKPVGAVKINWEHTLTGGLEDYWIFDGRQGDIVKNLGLDDGADLSIVGSDWQFMAERLYTDVGNVHPAGGGNMSLQPGHGGITHLPYVGYYPGSFKSYGNVYTVIEFVSTGNGDANVSGPGGASHTTGYFLNGKYHAAGGSFKIFTYTTNTGWGRYETVAVSRNGTSGSLYRDGILLDTVNGFTEGAEYQCYQHGLNQAESWMTRQGQSYCGIWKRELSADEIASVTSDPYQFLIPA